MSLGQFTQAVQVAIQRRDGQGLKTLFKFDGDGYGVVAQFATRGQQVNPADVQGRLSNVQPWGGIVSNFLQALAYNGRGEKLQACQTYREGVVKPMRDLIDEDAWVLPAVVYATTTLHTLSTRCDDEMLRRGIGVSNNSQLQQCAQLLQSLFSKTAAAKGSGVETKRAAGVAIGCIMMKVYFRLNTLTNCKNLIKTIDGPLNMFPTASKAHQVTFRYYTGRMAAYDEDFEKAEKDLTFALHHCLPASHANKRRILRYLIPIKMLLGILPSEQLLEEYKLREYADMATAVKTGSIQLLQQALETHQVALVQAGTYLLLEKLQLAVYRRLFKKCALVNAEMNPAKAVQVPLALFSKALELQGITKDDTELQCLVANLIYRKYIRGYIAFKQRVVVLAKTDAFPALSTVNLGDPFS